MNDSDVQYVHEAGVQPKQIAHVIECAAACVKLIDDLEESIAALTKRLDPFCLPATQSIREDLPPNPIRSPFAESLAGLRDRLWRQVNEIGELQARLDIE